MDSFKKLFSSSDEGDGSDTEPSNEEIIDITEAISQTCIECDNYPICNIVDKLMELAIQHEIILDVVSCKYEK